MMDEKQLRRFEQHLVSEDENLRWEAAEELTSGFYYRDEPETLWPLVVKLGCHENEDVRAAVSHILTCLLMYYFDTYFDKCAEIIRQGNLRFGDTLSQCDRFGEAGEKRNADKLDRFLEEMWSQAICEEPDSAILHYRRGLMFYERYDRACERVWTGPTFELVDDGVNKRDLEEALADVTKAIELDASFAEAYYLRGEIYTVYGEDEKALTDFNLAIELGLDMGLGVPKRALLLERKEDIGQAVESDASDAGAYYLRGWILAMYGRDEKALADFDLAIGIDANYAWAHFERAQLLEKKENTELAIAAYRHFLQLSEDPRWHKRFSEHPYWRGVAQRRLTVLESSSPDKKDEAQLPEAAQEDQIFRQLDEQLAEFHKDLAHQESPDALLSLLQSMKITSPLYSRKLEVYVLAMCEAVFVDLLNNPLNECEIAQQYLPEIYTYAQTISREIADPFFQVVYHLLMSFCLMKMKKREEALEQLLKFEEITSAHRYPEDERYVVLMKDFVESNKYEEAMGLFKERLLSLFGQHFQSLLELRRDAGMLKSALLKSTLSNEGSTE